MYMYYSRYTNNLQESAVIKANTLHRQQSTVNSCKYKERIYYSSIKTGVSSVSRIVMVPSQQREDNTRTNDTFKN